VVEPQPKIRISRAKAAAEKEFQTWSSWRLGASKSRAEPRLALFSFREIWLKSFTLSIIGFYELVFVSQQNTFILNFE
jgi:hypothetical protein